MARRRRDKIPPPRDATTIPEASRERSCPLRSRISHPLNLLLAAPVGLGVVVPRMSSDERLPSSESLSFPHGSFVRAGGDRTVALQLLLRSPLPPSFSSVCFCLRQNRCHFRRPFLSLGRRASGCWKIHSAMGEEQRGGASELRFSIWGSHGPLEVSKNGMDEKRFETTYLVLLARPACYQSLGRS